MTTTPCVTIGVTMLCSTCGNPFPPSGRRQYCSNACRQTAWRQRATTPTPTTNPTPKTGIIYQCPNCETRYQATQYCPDCNTFCRRLGPGGPCPHCDEPVAINDLNTH